MPGVYDFEAEEGEGPSPSKEQQDITRQIARCVPKLKGNSRNTQLKVLAGLLDKLPQDVASLGPGSTRDAMLGCLADRSILHSKLKDVRMYAAACFAQLLRIYAPDVPYGDRELEVGGC